jgi:hypothetical protein
MTAHATQWAAKPESEDERDSRVPPLPTEFLIANLELEFRLTYRKPSPLKISNRKYSAIFYPAATRPAAPNRTQWHRHSCLCAVAKPRTQGMANLAGSYLFIVRILIETPRLEFPLTSLIAPASKFLIETNVGFCVRPGGRHSSPSKRNGPNAPSAVLNPSPKLTLPSRAPILIFRRRRSHQWKIPSY